jgi:Cys-rich protein (TIGR01571 family)
MLLRCHRRKGIQQTGALNRVKTRRGKDPVRAQGTLNNMIDPATIGTLVCLIAGMILGLVSHIQSYYKVNQSETCFADCMSCCCPCMVYGQNRQRLDHLQDTDTVDPEHGGSGCGADCCMHLALNVMCGFGWVLQVSTDCCSSQLYVKNGCQLGQRATLRARYHIDGSPVNDCLTAFFCTPCELTQESRELSEEEMTASNTGTQTHTT